MDHVVGCGDGGRLLGRDRSRAALAAAVADARAGRRTVVLVEGEPGVGKTALLRVALAQEDATVIWASGDEAEAELDHGIIDQLVRAAPISTADRDALTALHGDALRTGAAMVAFADTLVLQPGRPLVLVVDDAQWADHPSLLALSFAARRLPRDPIVLCLVVRPSGADRLPRALRKLADEQGAHLRLEPLERDDVRELAERVSGRPVSTSTAQRLLEHTQGNPLHLLTLLDELPAAALLADAELPAPRSFSTLVVGRLAACSADAVALVTAVAVLGDDTPLADAAQLARTAEPLPALDEAIAQGFVVPSGAAAGTARGCLAMAHPLIRAAVLGDLPETRRADLHGRAAALVGGTAGLRHRLQGAIGPDPDLWRAAMDAAAVEADRGAHGAAAKLYRQAATVAAATEDRERSIQEAVDCLLLAGRLEEARYLRPAVDTAAPSARRAYVEGRLAYILGPRRSATAALDAAWAALLPDGAAAERLEGDERELAGRVAAMRAVVSVDRADGPAAIEWGVLALALAPGWAAGESTAHMLAGAFALAGRFADGVALLDDLCGSQRPDDAAHDARRADAFAGRGLLRLWSHELDDAVDDLEVSLDAAVRAGSFAARESARFYLAEVHYRAGRWDDAVLLAQVAASMVDDSDQDWMAALPHATAARPLAARGDPLADWHLERALAAAATTGGGVSAVLAQVSALEVAACRRDAATVVAIGDQLAGLPLGVHERIAPWRASYVEALVAVDRLADAVVVLEALRATPATPLVACDVARAAVSVAVGAAEVSAVDEAAEGGLALDPAAVGPYPRARLELAAGRAWRRRGERRRAVTVLDAAAARFQALGAAPWLDQVQAELQGSGLRPARRSVDPGTALTPQEQAVAHLVAQGRTNREVAAELVVSAKTVEHHLSRVYAKLGVRSRTELANTVPRSPS